MTSSLPIDLELEYFGWSEKLITCDLLESYDSIVDKTMCIAVFLIIYIYCITQIFFELIINELKINIFIPRISLLKLSEFFVLPGLSTK